MGFQPNFLGFQPMLNVGSVWAPRLLPNFICKLPDLFVAIDLRRLHDSCSFLLTKGQIQIGVFSVNNCLEAQLGC